jgi:hypothetical protein
MGKMATRRRDGVTYEPSGDTVVILDADGTVMTTLNPVGAVIWKALDGNRGAAQLARDLRDQFEGVDEKTLTADITEFIASLAQSGLVETD